MINNSSIQDKIQEYLSKCNFNKGNKPKEEEVNKNMMQFKQNSDEIFLLEKIIDDTKCSLYLHVIQQSVIKPSIRKLSIVIYDENTEIYELSKQKVYQLLLNEYFQEEYLAIYSDNEIFGFISFNYKVCKLPRHEVRGNFEDKLEFLKLNISQQIQSLKWYPHSRSHLAILTTSKELQIFDIVENLDEPETQIDLILPNSKLTEECIIDFCFSSTTQNYDLSHFSVFFISNLGLIYIKCPLLLNSTIYDKNIISDLKYRIENDEQNEKYLNYSQKQNLKQLINFIEQYSQNYEHSKNILKIKGLVQEFNDDLLQGPVRVYQNKQKKQTNKQFFLITKMDFVHHVFVIVSQKGNINIFISVQNVFPSTNYLQNKIFNKCIETNDFYLIEIDRLKVQCEILSNIKDEKLFKFRNHLIRPIVNQDQQRQDILYIYFFNKIYLLNLEKLRGELDPEQDILCYIESIRESINLQILLDIPCKESFEDLSEFGYYCAKIIYGNIFIIRQDILNIFPSQYFGFKCPSENKLKKEDFIQIVNIMPKDIIKNNDVKNIDNFKEYLKNIDQAQQYFVNQNQKKLCQIDSIYKQTFEMIKENLDQHMELPQKIEKRVEKIEQQQQFIQETIAKINSKLLNIDLNQAMYYNFLEQLNQIQKQLDYTNEQSQMIIKKLNQNRKNFKELGNKSKQIVLSENIKEELIKLFKNRQQIHKKINYLEKQKQI